MSAVLEIEEARETLGISRNVMAKMEPGSSQQFIQEVEQKFVMKTHLRWWWSAFHKPVFFVSLFTQEAYRHLHELLPQPNNTYAFVVGIEDENDKDIAVYHGNIFTIESIINECSAFEYYLIPSTMDCILCENHHAEIVGSGMSLVEYYKSFLANRGSLIQSHRLVY